MRKPRKPRPREKNVPKGYDSKWEHELHQGILSNWKHHTTKVPYVVEHNYEPDFEKDQIIIEAKVDSGIMQNIVNISGFVKHYLIQ